MAPADPSGVEALVRAECVRALFERNAVAQATVLLNSAIAVLVLWGQAPPVRLVAWAGATWLVAAGRLGLGVAFRRAGPPPGEVGRWGRWFTAGAAANGAIWGAAPSWSAGAHRWRTSSSWPSSSGAWRPARP
jgi:hypothetical protein